MTDKVGSSKLVLVDGHAMLYRAFFAFPKSLTTRKGEMINAVYGFTRILFNLLTELKPEYVAVSFDVGKTFRHERFPEYKAHREKMPDELKQQEKRVYEVVSALEVPVVIKEGYEADDVIGTLAKQVTSHKKQESVEAVIVTGDMDALQLIEDGKVSVYTPGGGRKPSKMYDEAAVVEKYGLLPKQIIDLKALAGDSSDNIPGVRGVGPKTATMLLKEFGLLENIYSFIDGIPSRQTRNPLLAGRDDKLDLKSLSSLSSEQKKKFGLTDAVVKKLVNGREMAFESKELVTIVTDVDVEFSLNDSIVRDYDMERAEGLFEELGFKSLLRQMPASSRLTVDKPAIQQQSLF